MLLVPGKTILVLLLRIGEEGLERVLNLRMMMVGEVFLVHEVGVMVLYLALGGTMTGLDLTSCRRFTYGRKIIFPIPKLKNHFLKFFFVKLGGNHR